MAIQIVKVDSPVTRFAQSFVNLTNIDSTLYPSTTSVTIDSTITPALTSYYIYDQWAFRTIGYDQP